MDKLINKKIELENSCWTMDSFFFYLCSDKTVFLQVEKLLFLPILYIQLLLVLNDVIKCVVNFATNVPDKEKKILLQNSAELFKFS